MSVKCPSCRGELEAGTLRGRGMEHFLPDGQKPVRLHTKKEYERKNAVVLPIQETEDIYTWPKAYICRTCRIVFVPY